MRHPDHLFEPAAPGCAAPETTDLVNGIKLALKQAGNKAGNFTVKYSPDDYSTAQAGSWTRRTVRERPNRPRRTRNVAYIGEFNSGASAVSIPILSDAKVPQICPANTAVGLTSDEPGASPGEPDKYYPTRLPQLHPHRAQGHDPGRGAGDL